MKHHAFLAVLLGALAGEVVLSESDVLGLVLAWNEWAERTLQRQIGRVTWYGCFFTLLQRLITAGSTRQRSDVL